MHGHPDLTTVFINFPVAQPFPSAIILVSFPVNFGSGSDFFASFSCLTFV